MGEGKRRVAVVGAGAAGLVVSRWLQHSGFWNEVVLFEQTNHVGGTWVYEPVDDPSKQVFSSMYLNLRTNLPRHIMGYLDTPFPEDLPTFPGHRAVAEYLNHYYEEHLRDSVTTRLQCQITDISPVNPSDPLCGDFSVRWNDLSGERSEHEEQFNHVAVCNGHYSTPFLPDIDGLQFFTGTIEHSHTYRTSEPYRGKKILILGAGASAADIGQEVALVAKEVHQCSRGNTGNFYKVMTEDFPNYLVHPTIKRIREDGQIELVNGDILQVDTILFCTGYHYDFPFLSAEQNKIDFQYKRIEGLYQQIFPFNVHHPDFNEIRSHARSPSIAFVGLPWKVVPFPLFDLQARYITKAWNDGTLFETPETIIQSMQSDVEHNSPPHYLHLLGGKQWEYCANLARVGGFYHTIGVQLAELEQIYDATAHIRATMPSGYKDTTLSKRDGVWGYFSSFSAKDD